MPIPISVIGGAQIDRERAFTIADLTQRAPGLTATTPNARRTGVSIRGIGKTSGNDNMEAAVGVIVDDVFLGHVGMSYQDFTDLERVEILRGPQGTLLGKNTSLGVIKYTSRAPSFTPEGSFDVELGLDPGATKTRGSFSNALDRRRARVPRLVLRRRAGRRPRQRQPGRRRPLARAQPLRRPLRSCCSRRATTLSVSFNLDRAATDENSNTKPFMVDPLTLDDGSPRGTTYSTRLARGYFGGYAPIIGSWDEIDVDMGEAAEDRATRGSRPSSTGTSGGVTSDVDHGGALVPLRREQRPGADALRRSAAPARWSTRSRCRRSSASRVAERQARLSGRALLLQHQTDTTARNYNGADAGAFFATNAQYTALNNAERPAAAARVAERRARRRPTQNPTTDSVAVFGQVELAPHRARRR